MHRESMQLIDTPADWALVPKDAVAAPVLEIAPAVLLMSVVLDMQDTAFQAQSLGTRMDSKPGAIAQPATRGAQNALNS